MSELSKKVAELVGYRVRYPIDHTSNALYALPALGYELVRPDGSSLLPAKPIFDPEVLWDNAPDYSNDIEECIKALDATGADWTLRNYDDVMMRRRKVCELDSIEAEGATYALAACAALVAYYRRRSMFTAELSDADRGE